jgi:hypothetical protein
VGTGSGPKSNERWTPEHGTDRIVASRIAYCLIVPTESLPVKSLVVYLGPIPVPNSWVIVETGSGPKSNVR